MKRNAIIFIILSLLFLARPADALLGRSSEKECTLCHVLWMRAFSTDQKTLIGPIESNIVVAGSVGLSSSRRMCTSCHDGYVQDSRTAIVAGNKHHQIKKVPDWLTLPDIFRLDSNNEFYCGTCHGFHDIRGMGDLGSMPFMRMNNDRSEMCMACHTNQTLKSGSRNHPVVKKSYTLPKEMIERLGGKLGPEGEIICQSCHKPHGKPSLLVPLKDSDICLLCHQDKKTVFASDHNLSRTAPAMKNIHGNTIAETGPCSSCHVPHNGAGRRLWARQIGKGNPASQSCLSCHGKEEGLKDTGEHSHPVGVGHKKNSRLPLFSAEGLRVENGTVQCASCHDVHQWNPDSLEDYAGDMEGGATNSFLRISNAYSGLCFTCHEDMQGIIGTDHDLRITAPDATNRQGFDPYASGVCGVCHIPHNATGAKLWAREPQAGNPASALCLACHGGETEHMKKTIGLSHPIDVSPLPGTVASPDLPLFSELGTRVPAGEVHCATCHNGHQWNPDSLPDDQEPNDEGDGANSFLRIASRSQSQLCQQCHADKNQVIASDHNLALTAPAEKNYTGATPSESGPCGGCHIPHHATGKRLWAKPLSGNQDFITQVCTSCHNKDGAAGKKSIGENTHPVNVAPGFTVGKDLPLYSGAGDKEADGRVVCTTCHDPHTWVPGTASIPQGNTPLANREGDAASSFLRRANGASSLCTTCHQTEGQVLGTPHDLGITAPNEKNSLEQTVKESGPCGACHLVHNSPGALKLWARPYGPIKKNENRMSGLCTSCHSRGNVAQNKVQQIATHPEGVLTSYEEGFIRVVYDDEPFTKKEENGRRKKALTERYTPILINNVVGFAKGKEYTPIFDDQGKEVRTGKISCPSCHNAHVWRLDQKKSEANNGQMDRKGTKFLRTPSSNTVCVECHGPDALFRYLYFHEPTSRAQGGGR